MKESDVKLLKELREAGTIGLDLSPGDRVSWEAYLRLKELLK